MVGPVALAAFLTFVEAGPEELGPLGLEGLLQCLFHQGLHEIPVFHHPAEENENAASAAHLIQSTVWKEGMGGRPQVLHADNGSPMKAATMRVTRQKLGIEPSYSRPRVSDDNPDSEASFRTWKYRPDFPERGFLHTR